MIGDCYRYTSNRPLTAGGFHKLVVLGRTIKEDATTVDCEVFEVVENSHPHMSNITKFGFMRQHMRAGSIEKIAEPPVDVDALAQAAMDAACLLIQRRLGVQDGGFAAVFFSGYEVTDRLEEYIRAEMREIANRKSVS